MSTILKVVEATIRAESRPVNVAANARPRTKIYADTDCGIIAMYVDSERVPAPGTRVLAEQVTGEREDGSTWTAWQIG